MRVRLVLFLALATACAALVASGCGGDSSGADPATVAPEDASVHIDIAVRPEGELQSNIEGLAENLAGIDDLGGLVIDEIEDEAVEEGEDFDYEQEVEPWLGERAGISMWGYDGESFDGVVFAIATTDNGAAEEFLDSIATGEVEKSSYEGVDFQVDEDGDAAGIIGDLLVLAEDEAAFKESVDASEGDSLADEDAYSDSLDAAPGDSFANVFVDVGGLIEDAGGTIDPEVEEALDTAGIEPKEATAMASIVPGADYIEVDFTTDLFSEQVPVGDPSELLGSLPGGSFLAFAADDFGTVLTEGIDELDENGIPGQLEPNELKSALKSKGIDLDRIGGSITDLGVFAQGSTERNLTGAVVLGTDDADEAENTVANIGLLLRAEGTPGITKISEDGMTGFSVRAEDPGDQPFVVAAKGSKIAISYGPIGAAAVLSAGKSATLADNPAFEKAGDALGDTPISGFLAGPATMALVDNLISPEEQAELEAFRPLLDKLEYVAVGAGEQDDLTTSKLVIGFEPDSDEE